MTTSLKERYHALRNSPGGMRKEARYIWCKHARWN